VAKELIQFDFVSIAQMTTIMTFIVKLLFARDAVKVFGINVRQDVGVGCRNDILLRRFHAMSSLEMTAVVRHIWITHVTGTTKEIWVFWVRENARRGCA